MARDTLDTTSAPVTVADEALSDPQQEQQEKQQHEQEEATAVDDSSAGLASHSCAEEPLTDAMALEVCNEAVASSSALGAATLAIPECQGGTAHGNPPIDASVLPQPTSSAVDSPANEVKVRVVFLHRASSSKARSIVPLSRIRCRFDEAVALECLIQAGGNFQRGIEVRNIHAIFMKILCLKSLTTV